MRLLLDCMYDAFGDYDDSLACHEAPFISLSLYLQ